MTHRLITISNIQGQMARWVVEQSPHSKGRGVDQVNMALFQASLEWEGLLSDPRFRMMHFASWRDIVKWLEATLKGNEWLGRWNAAYKGRFAVPGADGMMMTSRFDTPAYDYDFIDIDALFRNVAMSVWRDAKDYTDGAKDDDEASVTVSSVGPDS